ncbi:MAG: hypothetical protein DMF80_13620 [Acidobacteria bacterium]|nr:MAG: hypothetical protein DMF80_13620 [Acidobacteriota bacterium]
MPHVAGPGRRVPALLTLVLAVSSGAAAHEIPADIAVRVFVKPEGQRLRLLVRAPLAAMRDIEFPQRGPGYLDLARADASLRHAAMLWIAGSVRLYEDDRRLESSRIVAVRVSLPSDRSFADYEQALVHLTDAPLPTDTEIYWSQALLDVLFEYPVHSDRSQFSIDPGLAILGVRVVTVLGFLPPGGSPRLFELAGDPGLVRLDPRWHQAALRFVDLGFRHILGGIDHLLFLLCLVIPLRRILPLAAVVTSFTIAHSITLVASAFGVAPGALWFPPLIEALIALSIVTMALENIVGPRLPRRWLIAFAFGLVHGFGFSFALRQSLQLAGSHLLTSLLSFNVGVELGQLLVLALLVPMLEVLFRFVVAERVGTIILSALVAHTGWHWMVERGDRLRQFRFAWPALDAALLASAMRWAMLGLVLLGVAWLMSGLLRRFAPYRDRSAV